MSIGGRRIPVLTLAVVAVLVLAVAITSATIANRNSEVHSGEMKAEVFKMTDAPNNKNSSEVGVCVYDEARNRHHFRKMPKPKKSETNSEFQKERSRGGQVANSPADCDRLNALLANPPKDEHDSDLKPADGPPKKASPSGAEGSYERPGDVR